MGLQGRPWNDCKGQEKAALRKVFDGLKATHRPAPPDPMDEMEQILDRIGIIDVK